MSKKSLPQSVCVVSVGLCVLMVCLVLGWRPGQDRDRSVEKHSQKAVLDIQATRRLKPGPAQQRGITFDGYGELQSTRGPRAQTDPSRWAWIVGDVSRDDASRLGAAEEILQTAHPDEMTGLLQAILDAHKMEHHEFRDRLLQLIADRAQEESAKILFSAVEGPGSGQSLDPIPDELRYALAKAIRSALRDDTLVSLITESRSTKGYDTYPSKPELGYGSAMISSFVKAASEAGDAARTSELIDFLTEMDDPRALGSFVFLAEESTLSLEDIASRAHAWATRQQSEVTDQCIDYLSSLKYGSQARIVAAFALAGSSEQDNALHALLKAMDHETDPLVKSYLDVALGLLEDRMQGAQAGVRSSL